MTEPDVVERKDLRCSCGGLVAMTRQEDHMCWERSMADDMERQRVAMEAIAAALNRIADRLGGE